MRDSSVVRARQAVRADDRQLLAVDAAERELAAWDTHHARLVDLLRGGLADPDIASVAEMTAGLLPRDPGRARRALEIARNQWRALGNEPRLQAVEGALARLPVA